MGLETLLDPVLGWVLILPLWASLLILAALLTLIINLIYKFVTDQDEMKRLKKKIKESQKEMRANRHDVKKMQKLQKEAMDTNMKYTMKSLKPTLFTFIPLIIIFAWMNANLAYTPIMPGEEFTVSAELAVPAQITMNTSLELVGEPTKETIERQVRFKLSGPPGEHPFTLTTDTGESVDHYVLIGEKPKDPVVPVEDPFKKVEVGYEKAKPFGSFSIFGYEPGWLFTYIIFSIVLSIGSRKLMGIH